MLFLRAVLQTQLISPSAHASVVLITPIFSTLRQAFTPSRALPFHQQWTWCYNTLPQNDIFVCHKFQGTFAYPIVQGTFAYPIGIFILQSRESICVSIAGLCLYVLQLLSFMLQIQLISPSAHTSVVLIPPIFLTLCQSFTPSHALPFRSSRPTFSLLSHWPAFVVLIPPIYPPFTPSRALRFQSLRTTF